MTAPTLTQRVVGSSADQVSRPEEVNGYIFWGLVALFIAVPELLAAFSKSMKADIPWPTISNLVGKDLERHHHWVALIVVGLIIVVALHTFTYPAQNKKLGQPVGGDAANVPVVDAHWGLLYIALTAVVSAAAGLIASGADAGKNALGYTIYLTLVAMGVVAPSLFRHWRGKVLAIPTLFASIALIRGHRYCHWVAAFLVALLIVLCFHLALYPWPNYHFGSP